MSSFFHPGLACRAPLTPIPEAFNLEESHTLEAGLKDLETYIRLELADNHFDEYFGGFRDGCKELDTHEFKDFFAKLVKIFFEARGGEWLPSEKGKVIELLCHYIASRCPYCDIYSFEAQSLFTDLAAMLNIDPAQSSAWIDEGCAEIASLIDKHIFDEDQIRREAHALFALFEKIKGIEPNPSLIGLLSLGSRKQVEAANTAALEIPACKLYMDILLGICRVIYKGHRQDTYRLNWIFNILLRGISNCKNCNASVEFEEEDLGLFTYFLDHTGLELPFAAEFYRDLIFRGTEPMLSLKSRMQLLYVLIEKAKNSLKFTTGDLSLLADIFYDSFPNDLDRVKALQERIEDLRFLCSSRTITKMKVIWLAGDFRNKILKNVILFNEVLKLSEKLGNARKQDMIRTMGYCVREQFKSNLNLLSFNDLDFYAECVGFLSEIPFMAEDLSSIHFAFLLDLFASKRMPQFLSLQGLAPYRAGIEKLLMKPCKTWMQDGIKLALADLSSMKRMDTQTVFPSFFMDIKFISLLSYFSAAEAREYAGYQTEFYLNFVVELCGQYANFAKSKFDAAELINRVLDEAHAYRPEESVLPDRCRMLHRKILSQPIFLIEDSLALLAKVAANKKTPPGYFDEIIGDLFKNAGIAPMSFYDIYLLLHFYMVSKKTTKSTYVETDMLLGILSSPSIYFPSEKTEHLKHFKGFEVWRTQTKAIVQLISELPKRQDKALYFHNGFIPQFEAYKGVLTPAQMLQYWDCVAPLFIGRECPSQIRQEIFRILLQLSGPNRIESTRIFAKLIDVFHLDMSWLPDLMVVLIEKVEKNPNYRIELCLDYLFKNPGFIAFSSKALIGKLIESNVRLSLVNVFKVCEIVLEMQKENRRVKEWIFFYIMHHIGSEMFYDYEDFAQAVGLLNQCKDAVNPKHKARVLRELEGILTRELVSDNNFRNLIEDDFVEAPAYMIQSTALVQEFGGNWNKILLLQYLRLLGAAWESIAGLQEHLKKAAQSLNEYDELSPYALAFTQHVRKLDCLHFLKLWCSAKFEQDYQKFKDQKLLTGEDIASIKVVANEAGR